MIKKWNDRFVLLSKDGKKKLGEFTTRGQAEEREKEIVRIKRAKALDKFKSERDKRSII